MTAQHFHPSDDALVAFLLADLEDGAHEDIDAHLDTCAGCRRDHADAAELLALLALAAPAVAPPDGLRAWVLDVPRREPHAVPAAPARRAPWSRLRLRLAVPAVAVVALAAVALLLSDRNDPGVRAVPFSAAAGSLEVTGDSARLASWSLGAPPAGHGYELWVMRTGEAPRAAGMMMAPGERPVIDGVRPGDTIAVTVEPAAGSAAPTTMPVAVARIA